MSNNKEMIAQKKKKNARRQRGASLVEYALLVALIAVGTAAIIGPLGSKVQDAFQDLDDEFGAATGN